MVAFNHENTMSKVVTIDFLRNAISFFFKSSNSSLSIRDNLIENINNEFSNKSPSEIESAFLDKIKQLEEDDACSKSPSWHL